MTASKNTATTESDSGEPSAWGRVWHAPTNPAKTQTEVLQDVAASVGRTIGPVK